MKRLITKFTSLVTVLVLALAGLGMPIAHAYSNSSLISDSVYNDTTTMSASQIDNWLNSNFGSASCISTSHGFAAPQPTGYTPSGGFTYGGAVSAGTVIYDAAKVYGLNPQVILVTLQKEQSLVTGGGGCTVLGDSGAMGYGCPDGGTVHSYPAEGALPAPLFYLNGSPITGVNGTCVNSAAKVGFSQQVIHGAWLLKFGQQRSLGNTGWNAQLSNFPNAGNVWNNSDDPGSCYGGPMTQGTLSRGCSQPTAYYDGYTTIDGSAVHMDTGGTAALYWYTPHFSGNQHFDSLFTSWFGDPSTACSASSNLTGLGSGRKISAFKYTASSPVTLALTQMNNTGSACAELHVWNPGYQNWMTHIATGMRSSDPSLGTLLPMNFGNGKHGLIYVAYDGAGGRVEVHKFSPDFQKMPGYYDVSTNLGGTNPSNGTFVTGDFFNRGYDQLAYVLYNGANGHVEVHMFDPSLQKAIGYYDVATDLTGVSYLTGTFVSGNFFGRGYDQLAYVLFNGGTGHVEVHVFDPSMRKAIGYYDVSTDLTGVSTNSGAFTAGDFWGRGYEQLAFVLYSGSSGKVEVHTFSPDLRRAIGVQDIPTNLPGFDVTQ